MDGVTFKQIDASGVEVWLAGLREELVSKTYRPDPVRRATIPKAGGGERPLGTIRDLLRGAAGDKRRRDIVSIPFALLDGMRLRILC